MDKKLILKILGILGGIFVLLCIVIGITFWAMAPKIKSWAKDKLEGLKEAGEEVSSEAIAFGTGKPAGLCVDEMLRRYDGDRSLSGIFRHKIFITKCLEVANPDPELCEGIPEFELSNVLDIALWSGDFCAEKGYPNDEACTRLVRDVLKHCGRLQE